MHYYFALPMKWSFYGFFFKLFKTFFYVFSSKKGGGLSDFYIFL